VNPRIVLASQSASRKAILTGAGVPFEAASPGVDEDALKAELLSRGATPRDVAAALAEAKALALPRAPDELVIGSDQTLEFEGRLYDKAASVEEARERLKLLRGRTHRLEGCVVVARAGQAIWRETATSTLAMRDFSDAFLEDYLATEGPAALGSVGCYRLEGPGAQLFTRIEGDYFAILGLPLLGLLDLFRREGALPA
jgi:septum formation protein